MLDKNAKNQLEKKFKELKNPISLILFISSKQNVNYCSEFQNFLEELSLLSGSKISLKIYSIESDIMRAKQYNISNAPALIIMGMQKRNLIYHGLPAGHEFIPFIQTLIDISKDESLLSKDLKNKINSIDFPVNIKVFVSPTCPYCSAAMKTAFDFAMINPKITSEVFEVNEFVEIGEKYGVMGVPKTIVNETLELTGAYPPDILIGKILEIK
ncbi:MAG: thioredoxin family protein [Candidatus Micrarchaeia archaeon]